MNKTNNSGKNLNQSILKEYIRLIRANFSSLLIINIIIIIVATIYAITAQDIYTATTDIKITTPQGSILTSPLIPNSGNLGFGNDLLIANEIQTVTYNYTIREQVADAVIDSVESSSPSDFALIIDDENTAKSRGKLKEYDDILDILENNIKAYQLKGGVIQLDAQAKNLIDKLSNYEAQRNTAQIDLSILKGSLEKYKNELKQKDPSLITYLESKTSEPYLTSLQTQIAQLETQRDMVLMF